LELGIIFKEIGKQHEAVKTKESCFILAERTGKEEMLWRILEQIFQRVEKNLKNRGSSLIIDTDYPISYSVFIKTLLNIHLHFCAIKTTLYLQNYHDAIILYKCRGFHSFPNLKLGKGKLSTDIISNFRTKSYCPSLVHAQVTLVGDGVNRI
jgi:hypothetical protein